MRYFDASALAKRYLIEPDSADVSARLDAPAATSRLSAVEVASAIVRRAREHAFSRVERDRALRAVKIDMSDMLVVDVSEAVTDLASRLLVDHRLRSSDAIHLASCLTLRLELEADIPFVAFDARLREAAVSEGVPVEP